MAHDDGRALREAALSPSATEPVPVSSLPGNDQPRIEAFHAAVRKAQVVWDASERATIAAKAAEWLSGYGHRCTGEEGGTLWWTPAFAAACPGAKEACDYIRKAATMMLPTILAEAEDLAEADMLELMRLLPCDSDASLAEDAKRLSPDGVAARAEGIAKTSPESLPNPLDLETRG